MQGQAKPRKAKQSHARPSKAQQGQAKPCKAKQSHARQCQAKPCKAMPSKAKQCQAELVLGKQGQAKQIKLYFIVMLMCCKNNSSVINSIYSGQLHFSNNFCHIKFKFASKITKFQYWSSLDFLACFGSVEVYEQRDKHNTIKTLLVGPGSWRGLSQPVHWELQEHYGN